MAAVISTERLDLVPLLPDLLRLIDRGDIAAVARELGAAVPDGWEEGIPARLRLAQLAADPSEQPWLVRAVVLRKARGRRQRRLPRAARRARPCGDRL